MTATRLHPARADVPAVWVCRHCHTPVLDLTFCIECGQSWEHQKREREEAAKRAQIASTQADEKLRRGLAALPGGGEFATCSECGLGRLGPDDLLADEPRCEACRAPRGTMAELLKEADGELGYRRIPEGVHWVLRRHPALWWFASLAGTSRAWYLRHPFWGLLHDEFPKVTNAEWAVLCMDEGGAG